jgi:L,D-transpeptidase ErfK/SrfK
MPAEVVNGLPDMRGVAAIVVTALCLTGCGGTNIFTPQDGYPDVSEARPEQAPISSNRFTIEEGQDVVGEIQIVRAVYEDTFVDIARAYGLGYDELVAANPGVDPWLPGEGVPIILPTRFVLPSAAREGVVLNVAAKRLFYYPAGEEGDLPIVETYPVGIGRAGWQTPTGNTTVVSKARDPVWFVPRSVREEHLAAGDPLPKQVPPGPDNPLGAHVLALGIPGYLIHGTNKPAGVGMRVSHGCVRLYPDNIEHLFERVEIGSRVQIVNQPFLLGWQDGDLLLEAHALLAEDNRDWFGSLMARAKSSLVNYSGGKVVLDETRIKTIAEAQRGFPVSVFAGGPDTEMQVRNGRRVVNILEHQRVASSAVD